MGPASAREELAPEEPPCDELDADELPLNELPEELPPLVLVLPGELALEVDWLLLVLMLLLVLFAVLDQPA